MLCLSCSRNIDFHNALQLIHCTDNSESQMCLRRTYWKWLSLMLTITIGLVTHPTPNLPTVDVNSIQTHPKHAKLCPKSKPRTLSHESWLIPPLTYPRRGEPWPESIAIVFNFLGATPWEELVSIQQNFYPPWTLYRSSLRTLDSIYLKLNQRYLKQLIGNHRLPWNWFPRKH